MAVSRRPRSHGSEIWPGFVDALSAMLLVIIFLLVVFVLAQFFLSEALSGRDQALARLNQQVSELSELLALERHANADLRLNVAQLSASLQTSTEERDELVLRLDAEAERAVAAEGALTDARQIAEADRETITMQLATIEVLRRDVVALRQVRDDLEIEVGRLLSALETIKAEATELTDRASTHENERERLAAALTRAEAETEDLAARLKENNALTTALRDRTQELLARLATEEEKRQAAETTTTLAQRELETREIRLAELQALHLKTGEALDAEKTVSAAAQAQLALLNRQIEALRTQLARISQALDAAEAKDSEQNTVIANLGRRLNLALAQKVEELSRYRSEFFGRLREALGDRPDIRIVGDRFVFQSEVLFESASAGLGEEGQQSLAQLAATLLEISARIPEDLPWILRVDGHTDRIPIATGAFPSNWELASARATSVVKFLIEEGIPPRRLAATAFAEYQPIDPSSNEAAYGRNRRIEIKLTER